MKRYKFRICLDFIANQFQEELFGLFEVIFGTFTLSVLANRLLFGASRECKSVQKSLSTKLEIKSKQILNQREKGAGSMTINSNHRFPSPGTLT